MAKANQKKRSIKEIAIVYILDYFYHSLPSGIVFYATFHGWCSPVCLPRTICGRDGLRSPG